MNKELGQSDRHGRLHTVFGDNKLFLMRFSGTEFVNDLYSFHVDALSKDPKVDINKLIGTHARIDLTTRTKGERSFDGIVVKSQWGGVAENGIKYHLFLRPWLWRAKYRRNQRIFHDQTVIEIVSTILNEYGEPFQVEVQGDYPPLEYTVQYRESDLDFILRMLERFGISYFFKHDKSGHTLVLTDMIDTFEAVEGGKRPFFGSEQYHQYDKEHFTDWRPERNMTTDKIVVTDYNFKTPDAGMAATHVDDTGNRSGGPLEGYDFPGYYLDEDEGKGFAELRLNQERGQDVVHHAVGDCMSLSAGMRVSVSGEEIPDVTGKGFLCVAANHTYNSQSYGSGGGGAADGPDYTGSYSLVPDDAPFAPPRRQPEPKVNGPQTAVVVGPEGEEIHVDKFGRILVRFHWDRDEADSMYCRVAQTSAGNGWGSMVIPRIGMEVVVDFIEGHPDLPIVTGCVYNGKNAPPHELPHHKTRTTIKSDSHMGSGFNELRFEDEADEEEIFLHAQRYFNAVVKKDVTWHIEGNSHREIDESDSLHIGKDRDIKVVGDERKSIGASQSLDVGATRATTVGGNDVTDITGNFCTSAGGSARMEAGSNALLTAGMNLNVKAGINLVVESGMTLTLKAGGSFVTIGPSGVAISGATVLINSGGAAGSVGPVSKQNDTPKDYGGPHAKRYDRSKT